MRRKHFALWRFLICNKPNKLNAICGQHKNEGKYIWPSGGKVGRTDGRTDGPRGNGIKGAWRLGLRLMGWMSACVWLWYFVFGIIHYARVHNYMFWANCLWPDTILQHCVPRVNVSIHLFVGFRLVFVLFNWPMTWVQPKQNHWQSEELTMGKKSLQ